MAVLASTHMIPCCVGSPAALNLLALSLSLIPTPSWLQGEVGLNQCAYVPSILTYRGFEPLIMSPQAYLLWFGWNCFCLKSGLVWRFQCWLETSHQESATQSWHLKCMSVDVYISAVIDFMPYLQIVNWEMLSSININKWDYFIFLSKLRSIVYKKK